MKSVSATVDFTDCAFIGRRIPDDVWRRITRLTTENPAVDTWLTVSGPVRIVVRERYMDNAGS